MKKSFCFVLFLAACGTKAASTSNQASSKDDASGTVGAGSALTLAKVQAAIAAKGAKWTAANTPQSALNAASRAKRFGLKNGRPAVSHPALINDANDSAARDALPPSFDWRNQNGKNYVSPILDQADCGSCVAFAATGTFETQLNIARNDTQSAYELSPEYLFTAINADCNQGSYPEDAVNLLVTSGLPDNACMPYTSGSNGVDGQLGQACGNVSGRSIKAASYTMPTIGDGTISSVKRALMQGPLLTTLTVYEDFDYYTSGIYEHVAGPALGGHAMSIVGWNDNDQAWIVRNSWGASWGMNGYIEVAYADTSGIGQYTWALTIPEATPYVSFAGVRDAEVLSGQQTLAFDMQSLDGAQMTWQLQTQGYTVAQGNGYASNTGVTAAINTSNIGDGVYTLQPFASSGSMQVAGAPRLVYVLNGTENATFDVPAFDTTAPLSGMIDVVVNYTAAPVPLSRVTLSVTDSTGATMFGWSMNNPAASTDQGWWDTSWFADGSYSFNLGGSVGTQTVPTASFPFTVQNNVSSGASSGGTTGGSSGGSTGSGHKFNPL